MARDTRTEASETEGLWGTYEADTEALVDHVTRRLAPAGYVWPPDEPAWLAEAMNASWTRVLALADADPLP
jgi:hypothetical protein